MSDGWQHRADVLAAAIRERGGEILYRGFEDRPSIEVRWPAPSSDAGLSRMLWDARELASMFVDVAEARTGQRAEWGHRVVREIDAYRAERGWSPHGFGGEDEQVAQ